MNKPEIDLDEVAANLLAEFPDAGEIAPCTVLGHGFGSVVVETAGGMVFRIARIPGVHEAFARQRDLLAVVGPRVPAAVPQPKWLTGPCEGFKYGAMGYKKVPGQLLTEELFYAADHAAFTAGLARFLVALHVVPASETPMLRTTAPDDRRRHERTVRDEVMPVLRERLTPDEFSRAEAWWKAYLSDPVMLQYEPKVTHGDFWWGNMLVDETGSELLGVLDWELAANADRARDFGGLGYLGVPFMESVIDEYLRIATEPDADLKHRARLILQVREFYGVRHAAAYPKFREMDDALAKVRRVLAGMSD